MQWVAARDERSSMRPEMYAVVVELEAQGWRLRRQGHGWRMYCPCGAGGAAFPIPHTPANPANVAKRLRRNAELCPNSHELVR